jgi:hypothetical protein
MPLRSGSSSSSSGRSSWVVPSNGWSISSMSLSLSVLPGARCESERYGLSARARLRTTSPLHIGHVRRRVVNHGVL